VERAENQLAYLREGGKEIIQLATFPSASRLVVPRALAFCREVSRSIDINLHEMEAHQSLPALRRGEVDLALIDEYDPSPPLIEPGTDFIPLFTEQMCLVLPAQHHLGKPGLALTDCAAEQWITCHPGTLYHSAILSLCATAGFTPRITYTTNDFTVILAMVEAGLGVSLVPSISIAQVRYDIRCLVPSDYPTRRRISVAVRTVSRSRPAVRRLLHALTTVTADLDGLSLPDIHP